jgi:hypothetical protein
MVADRMTVAAMQKALTYLSKPLRIDATRNVVTFDLKGLSPVRAGLRTQIARAKGNGAVKS